MQHQLNCRDIEKTDAMEAAVNQNLARLMKKYYKLMRNDTKFKVEVRYFNDLKSFRITINADIGDKRHLHAIENHKDLFIAIKNSMIPLAKQLEKFKNVIVKSQRNEDFSPKILAENEADYEIDELEPEDYNQFNQQSND